MFELSNYLVGIYKVDDCTDSITLVNHPPAPLPPPSQTQPVNFTQPPDATMGNVTLRQQVKTLMQQEKTLMEQEETFRQQEDPKNMFAEISRLCGRETTFAPNLESTVMSHVVAAATNVAAMTGAESLNVP